MFRIMKQVFTLSLELLRCLKMQQGQLYVRGINDNWQSKFEIVLIHFAYSKLLAISNSPGLKGLSDLPILQKSILKQ